MFRIKLLAAVFSIFAAITEEIFPFRSEADDSPKTEKVLEWPPKEDETIEAKEDNATKTFTVTASVYYPEPSQTDSTPFITADGSKINKRNPGKHRWIAVSRDLHSRWGGHIQFGDSLWITGISDDLDGLYIVRDTMNRRIRNRIDILVGRKDKVFGFWDNVQISKLN